jgi:hypothetical protein
MAGPSAGGTDRVLNFERKKYPDLAGALRKQFNILADASAMAFVAYSEREQLEWIAANHNPGEPFKLDELMKNQLWENIDKLRV